MLPNVILICKYCTVNIVYYFSWIKRRSSQVDSHLNLTMGHGHNPRVLRWLKVTRHLCFKNSKNLRPQDILAFNSANKPLQAWTSRSCKFLLFFKHWCLVTLKVQNICKGLFLTLNTITSIRIIKASQS